MKGMGFNLVKSELAGGRIKCFKDLVKVVTKTALAKKIGKNNEGITRLIEYPEEFEIGELISLSIYCKIGLPAMLKIIGAGYDYKQESPESRNEKYLRVKPLLKMHGLETIEDIVKYVTISVVAGDLKMKRQRLGKMLKQVKHFELKDLISIGAFCNLTLKETFSIIIKSLNKQKKELSPE